MSYPANVVSIFLSSPGDVGDDRTRVMTVIQSWNQRNGRERGLFFNPLTWEYMVAPGISDYPQNVINEQVGDEYDVFLGIMWSRLGTPTPLAQSGTEEEFNRALRRHSAGDEVSVCFLFKVADIPMSTLDGEQFAKVQAFRKFVSDAGCFYRKFVDDATLINAVNLILDRIANSVANKPSTVQKRDLIPAVPSGNSPTRAVGELEDDDGLFEIKDQIEEEGDRFVQLMNDWTEWLQKAGEAAEKASDEINGMTRFGRPNEADFRKVVGRLTASLSKFADWSDEKIVEIEAVIDKYSTSFLKLVDVSRDFNESIDDLAQSKASMEILVAQISSNNQTLAQFVETLSEQPRLSKPLTKVTRRLVENHRKLMAISNSFRSNILEVVRQLQVMIDSK